MKYLFVLLTVLLVSDKAYAEENDGCISEYGFFSIIKRCGFSEIEIDISELVLTSIFFSVLSSLFYMLYKRNYHDVKKANIRLDFSRFTLIVSLIITTIILVKYEHILYIPSLVLGLVCLHWILMKYRPELELESENH